MKIEKIKELEVGMPVRELEATISNAFKPTTGTHEQYGKWQLQNVDLTDDTGTIRVCFKNHFINLEKGQIVKINSVFNEKHKTWHGITVTEYKKNKQLIVTAGAKLEIINGLSDNTPVKPQANAQKDPIPTHNEPIKDNIPDWDKLNLHKTRGIILAYSKDLCVAGKIEVEDIINRTEHFVNYIYNGIPELSKEQEEALKDDSGHDESIEFYEAAFGKKGDK